jgi:hypothetical protein
MIFWKPLLLLLCTSLLLLSNAYAKPTPPANMPLLFDDFREIEEQYENEKWLETFDSLDDFINDFKSSLREIRETVPYHTVKNLKRSYRNLKYSIQAQDPEATEVFFIKFQGIFHQILNSYDYKIPPSLAVIKGSIEEALEASEKDDFKDVVSEMKETKEYFSILVPTLKQKGASQENLDAFIAKIDAVMKAGESNDSEKLAGEITTLQKLFTEVMWLYED